MVAFGTGLPFTWPTTLKNISGDSSYLPLGMIEIEDKKSKNKNNSYRKEQQNRLILLIGFTLFLHHGFENCFFYK